MWSLPALDPNQEPLHEHVMGGETGYPLAPLGEPRAEFDGLKTAATAMLWSPSAGSSQLEDFVTLADGKLTRWNIGDGRYSRSWVRVTLMPHGTTFVSRCRQGWHITALSIPAPASVVREGVGCGYGLPATQNVGNIQHCSRNSTPTGEDFESSGSRLHPVELPPKRNLQRCSRSESSFANLRRFRSFRFDRSQILHPDRLRAVRLLPSLAFDAPFVFVLSYHSWI